MLTNTCEILFKKLKNWRHTVKQFFKYMRKIPIENVIFILICGLVVAICWFHALSRTIYSDFTPINGSFQNYNHWRRYLNGQIPYSDFTVYLGSGHLLLGSLLTGILGGSFTDSLFAGAFLTCLTSVLISFLISFLIIGSKTAAINITLLLFTIYSIFTTQFNRIFPYFITTAMNNSMDVGNSARFIRAGCIPLLVIFAYLCYRIINHYVVERHRLIVFTAVLSALTGATILYANDVGISAYVCMSFVYFIYLLKNYLAKPLQIVKWVIFWIAVSMIGFFVAVLVVSQGHIADFLSFTLDVAGDQFWYYARSAYKPYFLSDVRLDGAGYLAVCIAFYNLIKYCMQKKGSDLQRLAISFIILTALFSSTMYHILSGSHMREFLYFVVTVSLIAYVYRFSVTFQAEFPRTGKIKLSVCIFLLCLSFNSPRFYQIHDSSIEKRDVNSVYCEELGGYLWANYEAFTYMADKLHGDKFFSTYASALEVVTNQYQPTGTDYIIHVLGDNARKEYLNSFLNGDYKHVINVSRDYNEWLYWVSKANWFFYRELYMKYDLSETRGYIEHWQKAEHENTLNIPIDIDIIELDGGAYKIVCQSFDRSNAIVDLEVTYESKYTRPFLTDGLLHRLVHVEDITLGQLFEPGLSDYNLPPSADGLHVPVTLHQGKGEIIISVHPSNYAELHLKNIVVSKIIKNPYYAQHD